MNRIALIVAVILAGLGGFMMWLYKQRFEAAVGGGPPVAVAILSRDVPIGAVLTESDLAVRVVPSQFVEGRHVRAADASSVIGVRTANQLRGNESLFWTDLATSTTLTRNLSGLVRTGMRAVAIDLNDEGDLSGLIRPGDRVDLMLTVNPRSRGQSTHSIAQAVLVVAVGNDTGGPTASSKSECRPRGVTVALTAEHAAMVTHARTLGKVSVVLRNTDDVAIVDLEDSVKALAAATAAINEAPREPELERLVTELESMATRTGLSGGGTRPDDLARKLRELEKMGTSATGGVIPPGLPTPSEVEK